MAKKSPLLSAQPDTLSVCGKFLRKGQTVTVSESAIGSRERRAIASGKIFLRKTNTPGQVQVVRPKA